MVYRPNWTPQKPATAQDMAGGIYDEMLKRNPRPPGSPVSGSDRMNFVNSLAEKGQMGTNEGPVSLEQFYNKLGLGRPRYSDWETQQSRRPSSFGGRPRPQPKTLDAAMMGAGGMGGWNREDEYRGGSRLPPGGFGDAVGSTINPYGGRPRPMPRPYNPYAGQTQGPSSLSGAMAGGMGGYAGMPSGGKTRRPVGPVYTGGIDQPAASGGTNYPVNQFGKATGSNKWADLWQNKLDEWGPNSLAEQFYGPQDQENIQKLLEKPSPDRALQEMMFKQMQSKFEDPYNNMYAPYEQNFMSMMNDRLSNMAPGGSGNPTLAGTVGDVNAIFPQYQGLGDMPTSDYTAADYTGGRYTGANFEAAPWQKLGSLTDMPDYQQRLQDEMGMQRDATAGAYGSQRQAAMQQAAGYSGSEGMLNQTLADIGRQEGSGRIQAEREARGSLRGLLERETGAERGFRERQAMAKTGFGQEEAARRTGYDVGEAARKTGFSQDEAGRKTAFGQWGAERAGDWAKTQDERNWGAQMAGWGAAERETAARRALAQGDLAAALQIAGMSRDVAGQGYNSMNDMYKYVSDWQRQKKMMKEQKKQGMWELGGQLTGTVLAGLMGQSYGGAGGAISKGSPSGFNVPGTNYYLGG